MKNSIWVLSVLFLSSCGFINSELGLPNDNAAEQVVEGVLDAVVEKEIGVPVHIDLTPESPQK